MARAIEAAIEGSLPEDGQAMTGAEPLDGGAPDPAIARILVEYREDVAQATQIALADLRRAGDPDPVATLLGHPLPPATAA